MTRMPRNGVFAGRRARAGASFLAVAVVLAATSVSVDLAVPGFASAVQRSVVGTLSDVVEVVAVWGALPLGLLLLLTAGEPRAWRGWAAVVAAVAAPIAVQFTGVGDSPFLILLALAAAVGGYALIALGLSERRGDPGRPESVAVAVAVLAAAELAVVALGALHLLVWNPMAAVPELSLAQIYGILVERYGVVDGGPFVWAFGATLATVAGSIVAIQGARRGIVSTHDVVTVGLLLIHATTFFLWWAGFALGLNLADAFATVGGDVSSVGSLLALVGASCLAAAILLQLRRAPVRDDDPAANPGGIEDAPAAVTP
ncbi:hypothetical protein GCM10017608_03140 [Agromyces luteolus]|uniref:Uncharacterized protein n=1 Tax=Agromyces luteolus TaxID=88373 RepID=A0A7C9LBT1_9MICO|nr:hypothetical protein [Agromyces luteolus]MUN05832.1 hypothetical protein [Agromyces luteolus]GLK26382.1 hypothetical protein GCM10017608_03140 [Agromyces luteolus]